MLLYPVVPRETCTVWHVEQVNPVIDPWGGSMAALAFATKDRRTSSAASNPRVPIFMILSR
jgi:hypothetical protein